MTGSAANLIHFDQNCVRIAVEKNLAQRLDIAAFLTLSPKFFTAAAVIDDSPRLQRLVVGFLIHLSQHQDIARFRVLSDHGNQFVLGKIRAVHSRNVSSRVFFPTIVKRLR